jgi:hypothetical protein
MLAIILTTSLKIIFMYGAMQEGEILFWLRRLFENFVSLFPVSVQFYLRKPLFDCMFCMSSVWGLTFILLPLPFWLDIILCVAGLNYIWSSLIGFLHVEKDEAEEDKQVVQENIILLNNKIQKLEERIFPLG